MATGDPPRARSWVAEHLAPIEHVEQPVGDDEIVDASPGRPHEADGAPIEGHDAAGAEVDDLARDVPEAWRPVFGMGRRLGPSVQAAPSKTFELRNIPPRRSCAWIVEPAPVREHRNGSGRSRRQRRSRASSASAVSHVRPPSRLQHRDRLRCAGADEPEIGPASEGGDIRRRASSTTSLLLDQRPSGSPTATAAEGPSPRRIDGGRVEAIPDGAKELDRLRGKAELGAVGAPRGGCRRRSRWGRLFSS